MPHRGNYHRYHWISCRHFPRVSSFHLMSPQSTSGFWYGSPPRVGGARHPVRRRAQPLDAARPRRYLLQVPMSPFRCRRGRIPQLGHHLARLGRLAEQMLLRDARSIITQKRSASQYPENKLTLAAFFFRLNVAHWTPSSHLGLSAFGNRSIDGYR